MSKNVLEKDYELITNEWLADTISSCQIENEAECKKFLSNYLILILDNLTKIDPKSIIYLKKDLRSGFLSGCSLDQILKIHLNLKYVLERYLKNNPFLDSQFANDGITRVIFYQIDQYLLKITELFNSQFNLVVNYYKNRYIKLTENISEIIYSVSPRGSFNYISPSVKDKLDISPQELHTVYDLLKYMPLEDRNKYLEKLAEQIKHKTEVAVEIRLINMKDGRVRHFINHLFPILDSHNNMIHLEGILFDITELKESEEKYRKLVETAGDAIFVADAKTGIILDVNKKAEELLGLPANQIIGMHQTQLHPRDEAKEYARYFKNVVQGKRKHNNLWISHKDGHVIPVESSAVVTEIGGKKIVLGIFRDISERKRMEEQLRESEAKYRDIFDSVSDTFLIVAADGKIVEANPQAAKMYGYSHEDMLNLNVRGLVHPDFHHILEKNIQLTCQFQVESKHLRKDGSPIDVEVKVTPIEFKGQKQLAIIRDITERKLAEIALRQAHDRLEERVKERTRKLAEINQELHNEIAERRRAEDALKVSEERFRTLFENAGCDGMVIVDPQTKKFVLPNPRMCELTGYSKEELCKMGIPDIHPPESLPLVFEEFRKMITGETKVNKNIPVLRKDGKVIYCDITASWSQYAGQNLIVGIFRDVTEKKPL